MTTLQHGDQTYVFYGPDALVGAYNAAADSADVITLHFRYIGLLPK